ncbi:MAG: hypothetical protein ACRDYZ_13130, partial [Acidimicrobiales bacterium]
ADAVPIAPAPAAGGPVLGLPFARRGRRPRWWVVVLAAVLTGGAGAAVSVPLVGVAAAVAVAAALLLPQARAVTALLAVGLVAAAGATVVAGQVLHPVAESANWPAAYRDAGELAWTAVVFLGADAVVERGRAVAERRRAASEPGAVAHPSG